MDKLHTRDKDFAMDTIIKAPEPSSANQKQTLPKFLTSKNKKLIIVALVFIVVVAGTITGIAAWKRTHPKADSKQEALQLVEKLKDYVDLPTDETPSIAEVKDVTKLRDQPFYDIASNGDKVLVYQKAGKALLYRPSTKKVIEYTPVNIDTKQ